MDQEKQQNSNKLDLSARDGDSFAPLTGYEITSANLHIGAWKLCPEEVSSRCDTYFAAVINSVRAKLNGAIGRHYNNLMNRRRLVLIYRRRPVPI